MTWVEKLLLYLEAMTTYHPRINRRLKTLFDNYVRYLNRWKGRS